MREPLVYGAGEAPALVPKHRIVRDRRIVSAFADTDGAGPPELAYGHELRCACGAPFLEYGPGPAVVHERALLEFYAHTLSTEGE